MIGAFIIAFREVIEAGLIISIVLAATRGIPGRMRWVLLGVVGGLAGAGIGAYMDRQERQLRERTAGTDVQVIRRGDDLVLNIPSGITFAYDSSAVQPQFQRTLDQVAQTLAEYKETYIDVYGHTDATGSDAYNQALSERRAIAVADYLAGRGVQAARIATRGYGKTQPIASNDTDAGRAANRRVEIKIVPIRQNDLR